MQKLNNAEAGLEDRSLIGWGKTTRRPSRQRYPAEKLQGIVENALPRNKNQRAIEKSFLNQKDCIKKKSMELSVLCDVKVCAIIVGPDGRVETWPESHDDVRQVIQAYKNCPVDKKKRERPQELDHGGNNKKQKVCAVSEGVKRTGFTDEDVLRSIDAKLCEVRNRIN
ncbi:agamous-like MADS-box AGL81 [Olea europaea subsp. europaea]|uniref:Agamous-like MADS-box AGL81 n=1 Tax=Olea europaea subsp. europaea TaxID=158383 RepID=A0A8S0UAL6_OLEEU|nr:agamous-like MADS-box AGL81 [Olea europaea subsp. europaea]